MSNNNYYYDTWSEEKEKQLQERIDEVRKSQKNREKKRSRNQEKLHELIAYAENKGDFCIPEEFETKLYEKMKDRNKFIIPSTKAIDALFRAWEIWSKYVTPESISAFMADGIRCLCLIQATATFSIVGLNGFLGSIPGVKIIRKLPPHFATCSGLEGILKVDGKMVS